MPIVFVLCVVGAYAITSRTFDIYVMLAFGIMGFVLRLLKFPMAPMILGLVLGELLDKNLLRGLTLSSGSLEPFFTRPLAGTFAAITIASFLWSIPAVQERVRAAFRGTKRQPVS
jgi:putative tricarboxylic transport membrane protein